MKLRLSRSAIVASITCLVMLIPACILADARQKQVILYPSVGCSKEKCSPENPCCNECYLHGWITTDKRFLARAVSGKLPVFEADGCGQVGKFLDAEGVFDQGVFRVHSWKVVEEGRIFSVSGTCVRMRCSIYASGCRRPEAEMKAAVFGRQVRVQVIIPDSGECEASWKVELEKELCGLSPGDYVFSGVDDLEIKNSKEEDHGSLEQR